MTTLVRFAICSVAVGGLLVGAAHNAHAQKMTTEGPYYVLQASLVGKTVAEGKAQFRLKGRVFRSFEAHIAGAEPGEMMIIVLRRGEEVKKFAWLQANKQGVAEVFLSTVGGHPVPVLRKKDVIEIWSEHKGMTMQGEMY